MSDSGLRIRRTDVLLPLLFGVLGTVEIVTRGYQPRTVALATYWVAAALLCLRRVMPLAMPVLVAAVYGITPVLGYDVSEPAAWVLLLPLACLAAGLYVPRRLALAGLGSVTAALAGVLVALEMLTPFDPDAFFGVLWALGPWAVGNWVREAFDRNARLAAQVERTRAEAELAAASAAADERARIARELHDVLAHSLSVMVVQASVAEDLVDREPEAALDAIQQVQRSGREALAETGHLLRLIRDDDGELGLHPQRLLDDLPTLVEDCRRSGLDVALALDPAAVAAPPGVAVCAYRVVQEALTNALKHAPGSHVDVRVELRGEDLALEVRNEAGPTPPTVRVSGGRGLVGVRERVAVFGGTLRAGPTEDGGFVLAATLPGAVTSS